VALSLLVRPFEARQRFPTGLESRRRGFSPARHEARHPPSGATISAAAARACAKARLPLQDALVAFSSLLRLLSRGVEFRATPAERQLPHTAGKVSIFDVVALDASSVVVVPGRHGSRGVPRAYCRHDVAPLRFHVTRWHAARSQPWPNDCSLLESRNYSCNRYIVDSLRDERAQDHDRGSAS
jgi:hypothetical protein